MGQPISIPANWRICAGMEAIPALTLEIFLQKPMAIVARFLNRAGHLTKRIKCGKILDFKK
jgi:hypothetical protein